MRFSSQRGWSAPQDIGEATAGYGLRLVFPTVKHRPWKKIYQLVGEVLGLARGRAFGSIMRESWLRWEVGTKASPHIERVA